MNLAWIIYPLKTEKHLGKLDFKIILSSNYIWMTCRYAINMQVTKSKLEGDQELPTLLTFLSRKPQENVEECTGHSFSYN